MGVISVFGVWVRVGAVLGWGAGDGWYGARKKHPAVDLAGCEVLFGVVPVIARSFRRGLRCTRWGRCLAWRFGRRHAHHLHFRGWVG